MLITPSLLHVKTRPDASQQEAAALLRAPASGMFDFPEGLKAPQILARLDVPVMLRGPEATEWDCVRADHAAMANAGEWADLLDALRFADEDRSMASGGRRVMHLISEGARSGLRAALDQRDHASALAELGRFQAVFELHPQDLAAAHLLAQALIDIGTLERDLAAQGQLSQDLWAQSAAHFHAADLTQDLQGTPWMRQGFNKLLLDPPRSGADQVLKQLPLKNINRIVYVSCHPASLARDAGYLVNERGYRLNAAGVMDMFPHTGHVESIALFEMR